MISQVAFRTVSSLAFSGAWLAAGADLFQVTADSPLAAEVTESGDLRVKPCRVRAALSS
jgi:hypothetical protein